MVLLRDNNANGITSSVLKHLLVGEPFVIVINACNYELKHVTSCTHTHTHTHTLTHTQIATKAPRKTRGELAKFVDADYYGYRDEDDGIIVPLEQDEEKRGMPSYHAICTDLSMYM